MGSMHAGKLGSSKRLRQLLRTLADRRWHTTLEIQSAINSCAVHSDISALRRNGIFINSRPQGKRWEYKLADSFNLVRCLEEHGISVEGFLNG